MSSSLDIVIRATDAGASRTLAGVQGALKGVAGFGSNLLMAPFAGIAGPLAAGVAGFAALGAAVSFVKGSLAEASEAQEFEVRLLAVAGSATEAKKRLAELEQLKLETPFDTPELVAAEVSLARFSNNAWHGADALKLCGELAAGTGQSLESVSSTMGRVYAEIQSGVAGRGLATLQLSGVIDPKTKKDIEAMIAGGEKGDVVWQKLTQSASRFGGTMAAQMGTAAGKMSLLSKMWEDVQQEFGTPILDSLTPLLDQIKQYLPQIQEAAKTAGNAVSSVLQMTMKAFADGRFMELVGSAIVLGIEYVGGTIMAKFIDWGTYLGKSLAAAILAAIQVGKDYAQDAFGGEAANAAGWALAPGLQILNKSFGLFDESESRPKGDGFLDNFNRRLSELGSKDKWNFNNGPSTYMSDAMKEVLGEKLKNFLTDFMPKMPAVPAADVVIPASPKPGIDRVEPKAKSDKAGQERLTDSYARIGLFVGGAGATNYQSSIARNTERANKLLEQTNTHLQSLANRLTGSTPAWC